MGDLSDSDMALVEEEPAVEVAVEAPPSMTLEDAVADAMAQPSGTHLQTWCFASLANFGDTSLLAEGTEYR